MTLEDEMPWYSTHSFDLWLLPDENSDMMMKCGNAAQ